MPLAMPARLLLLACWQCCISSSAIRFAATARSTPAADARRQLQQQPEELPGECHTADTGLSSSSPACWGDGSQLVLHSDASRDHPGGLNVTGGYGVNQECSWRINCTGGPQSGSRKAAVLRFTNFSTETGFDLVSVADGDHADGGGGGCTAGTGQTARGAITELSGTPEPQKLKQMYFGARGSLDVNISFDGWIGGNPDGFYAEYWCEDPTSLLGCASLSATNYDVQATVDDGSCVYPDNQEGLLLLAALGNATHGLRGWSAEQANPCGGGSSGGCRWEGIACGEDKSAGWVTRVDLSRGNCSESGCKLGDALTDLPHMVFLNVAQGFTSQLSGTLPYTLGNLAQLEFFNVRGTQLSGTLPDSIGNLTRLVTLDVDGTQLSGTIPESMGRLVSLENLYIMELALSGTLGAKFFANLTSVVALWMSSLLLLSGTIPDLGPLVEVNEIELGGTRLSGTIPYLGGLNKLTKFGAANSAGLSGTVPRSLCAETVDLHSCALTKYGTGNLTGCGDRLIKTLDISNNLLTHLPRNLPAGLTHLYLGSNPLQTTATELNADVQSLANLTALDISFSYLGLDVKLCASQVTPALGCRLGSDAPPCVFGLQLIDSSGQPVKTGGLKPHLAIEICNATSSKQCDVTGQQMRHGMDDMGDGRYSVALSAVWAPKSTSVGLRLSLFDGPEEFIPEPGFDSNGLYMLSWDDHRMVRYEPIECSATVSVPDPATGSFCVCKKGFVRESSNVSSIGPTGCKRNCTGGLFGAACDQCPRFSKFFNAACRKCDAWAICPGGQLAEATSEPCAAGKQPDSSGSSCEACPPGRVTTGGTLCAPCGTGEEPARDATHCTCTFGHYNSSAVAGVKKQLQCLRHDWRADAPATDGLCIPCGNLECAQCGNGLTILPGYKGLVGSTYNVFRCPLENACPGGGQGCAVGYTGSLCGVCDAGYDRVHRSCKLCTDTGIYAAIFLFVLLAVGSATWIMWQRHREHAALQSSAVGPGLRAQLTAHNPLHGDGEAVQPQASNQASNQAMKVASLYRVLYHPGRIMVSFFQVVTQIGPVLHVDFPENMQWLLDALRPLAADLQSLLQIKCLSEFGFYGVWLIKTLVVPTALVGGVLLLYIRERGMMDTAVALERCRGHLFAVLFFVYPGVSNRAFAIFDCRQLGADLRVLREDYSVRCGNDAHMTFTLLAAAVAVFFSAGVPVALIAVMLRQARARDAVTDADRFVARRVAEELQLDDRAAIDVIQDVNMGKEYSFLVSAYHPRYFFWEGLDLLRKLAMVGLLVLAGQGSLSQIFIGLCLSVVTLGAQVYFEPYKHWQNNLLKLVTEAAIFLLLLVALVLKAAPVGRGPNELLSSEVYDVMLLGVFAGVVPGAFIWTVSSEQKQMRQALAANISGVNTDVDKRRRAIKLLQLGIASGAEVRLLSDYIGKLEYMVNKTLHVFISYRVAADAALAEALYEQLTARTVAATGQRLRVYLDVVRLEAGQRWDTGFMVGLANSMVFVPIVSIGALRSIANMSPDQDRCDNVLLEWTAALELYQRRSIQGVLPLLVGGPRGDFFAEMEAELDGIRSGLPDHVSAATMAKVSSHLAKVTEVGGSTEKLGDLIAETAGGRAPTIRRVVQTLLQFQGVKLSREATGSHAQANFDDGVADCANRAQQAVESSLHRIGTHDNAFQVVHSGEAAIAAESDVAAPV